MIIIFVASFLLWMVAMTLSDVDYGKVVGTAFLVIMLPFLLLIVMLVVPIILIFDKEKRNLFTSAIDKEQEIE